MTSFLLHVARVGFLKLRGTISAHFAGSAHWAETSATFAPRTRRSPINGKNAYLVFAFEKKLQPRH